MERTLSKNLKALIEIKKISVPELSRKTNVPVRTLLNYINNCEMTNYNVFYLNSLASFFNISLDHLLFNKETEMQKKVHSLQEAIQKFYA